MFPPCPLFKNCTEEEVSAFLQQAPCRQRAFEKGDILLRQGDPVLWAGVLLSGQAKGYHLTPGGTEQVRSILSPGEMFGFILMATEDNRSPVTVEALTAGEALYVPFAAIMNRQDALGDTLRLNLLHALSKKCWQLTRQVRYLGVKSLRGRLCRYFMDMLEETGSPLLHIPLSRTELAALLGVNRSAMVRELSRMEQEGLLECRKRAFRLLDLPRLQEAAEA